MIIMPPSGRGAPVSLEEDVPGVHRTAAPSSLMGQHVAAAVKTAMRVAGPAETEILVQSEPADEISSEPLHDGGGI